MNAAVETEYATLPPWRSHQAARATERTTLLNLVTRIEDSETTQHRRALADRLLRIMDAGVTVGLPCDEALRQSSQESLRQADAATPEFFLALYAVRDWVRSARR